MASSTTSDKEIGPNSLRPSGCGPNSPASLLLLLADALTSTRRRASNQNRFARNKWHVIPGTGH